jgi:glycosyltransferase involved in cell wall biosynthesis
MHNCRGSLPEALVYGAALALWQRRLLAQADVLVTPSRFALERLRRLGAPLPAGRVEVLPPPLELPAALPSRPRGEYALIASRLAPEKGIEVAIDACREIGMPLVIAGDGPARERLEARAVGADVRFAGEVGAAELARLRERAAVALVPSRAAETFGLAAAEAVAAGVPVLASDVGALSELLAPEQLVAPGDAQALARAIEAVADDRGVAERALERVRELCAPERVAARLAEIYSIAQPAGPIPTRH